MDSSKTTQSRSGGNPVKRLLIQCSGADRSLLREAQIDENKYAGIGGTVLFTGILAFFSAGYAIYTVFDSYFFAILFGVIWGLMIFNLDRFIVSSMKSRGSFFRDFFTALPRLVLAILLALVISKPLELKIFEKEINAELALMEQEVYKTQEAKVQERYEGPMKRMETEIAGLQEEIDEKAAQRDSLALMALQEADGTGGSGVKNLGPIYRAKKADADQAQAELEATRERLQPVIAKKRNRLRELDSLANADIAAIDRKGYDGMAARMEALHRLGEDSSAIYWANIFIILLFIAIETAPIFVKLISRRSPYDFLLYKAEKDYEIASLEKVALLNNASKNKVHFETETATYRTKKEVEAEKALTDTYLKRKRAALEEQDLDWETPFVKGRIGE